MISIKNDVSVSKLTFKDIGLYEAFILGDLSSWGDCSCHNYYIKIRDDVTDNNAIVIDPPSSPVLGKIVFKVVLLSLSDRVTPIDLELRFSLGD